VKFIKDPNLKAQLVTKGLDHPTSMIFLSQDDILVTEKQGKVQRIIGKNVSDSPVLDLTSIVNSTGERGLLGIAISQAKQTSKNEKYDDDPSIYLIFTRSVNDTKSNNINCMMTCNTTESIVNSLYRYKFSDGQLLNPKPLLHVPLYSNDSIQHIGGAVAVGHNAKIYFTTGDGRGCEFYEDCNPKIANIKDSIGTTGRGGIFFITENRQKGDSNPHGDNYSQYAYGIRNSFGLDFDPVTGNLWDTENGPAFGDELNLVKPGFNSGWAKVQGIWPIENYSELVNNPPPGVPKGYYFPNGAQPEDDYETHADINEKGNYSDPEFTWNHTVGVTSIKFFNSDKLGKKYENDLFVGTFKGGFLYHFDLDKDRNQLLLKGGLKDKVANNDDELRDVIFARGFGPIGVTDLEVGPDGYLYVLVYGTDGAIYKIVPK